MLVAEGRNELNVQMTPLDIKFLVAIVNAEALDENAAYWGYPEGGQWSPQIFDIAQQYAIRPDDEDWIGEPGKTTSVVFLTVPYNPSYPTGGPYWNPEYPSVYLSIVGGPVNGRVYGPLNTAYGSPVSVYQGCTVTFDYISKALTVS